MFQNTCVDLLMVPCIMSLLERTQNSSIGKLIQSCSKEDKAAEEPPYIFRTTLFALRDLLLYGIFRTTLQSISGDRLILVFS